MNPNLKLAVCHFCKAARETCALVYMRIEGLATRFASHAIPVCGACRKDRPGKWRHKRTEEKLR